MAVSKRVIKSLGYKDTIEVVSVLPVSFGERKFKLERDNPFIVLGVFGINASQNVALLDGSILRIEVDDVISYKDSVYSNIYTTNYLDSAGTLKFGYNNILNNNSLRNNIDEFITGDCIIECLSTNYLPNFNGFVMIKELVRNV